MGDIADLDADRAEEYEAYKEKQMHHADNFDDFADLQNQLAEERLAEWQDINQGKYWITKEGQKIAFTDMGDSHLISTIRFIIKKRSEHLFFPQGEAAWPYLIEEAERRDIHIQGVTITAKEKRQ